MSRREASEAGDRSSRSVEWPFSGERRQRLEIVCTDEKTGLRRECAPAGHQEHFLDQRHAGFTSRLNHDRWHRIRAPEIDFDRSIGPRQDALPLITAQVRNDAAQHGRDVRARAERRRAFDRLGSRRNIDREEK